MELSLRTHHLPLSCCSHSLTLSICSLSRSLRSSYSSLITSSLTENIARPRDASLPANTLYGPSANKKSHAYSGKIICLLYSVNIWSYIGLSARHTASNDTFQCAGTEVYNSILFLIFSSHQCYHRLTTCRRQVIKLVTSTCTSHEVFHYLLLHCRD